MSLVVVGSVALDSIETTKVTKERVLGGAASFFSVVNVIWSSFIAT